MKTIVRYLCAQCAQEVKAAGLKSEDQPTDQRQRGKCAWCGRSCFGTSVKIWYGRDGN